MPATKSKKTIKVQRHHICRFESGQLVRIATRQRYGSADRIREQHSNSFVVLEVVAIDPDASDLGTVYFFDENGGNMEAYTEILYR